MKLSALALLLSMAAFPATAQLLMLDSGPIETGAGGGGTCAITQPIDGSYHLSFDEEFNGASLDTVKWSIATNNPGPGTYVNNRFNPANVSVSGGSLDLSVSQSGTTPPYNAGFITTGSSSGNFHTGPSYIEARIKFPTSVNGAAHGLVPAFWGNGFYTGGPNSDPPEIDFPEWRGHNPTKEFLAVYPTPDTTSGFGFVPSPVGIPDTGADLGAGYHVFGLLWTATQVKWYMDGTLIGTVTNGQVDPNGRTAVVQSNQISLILNNTAQMNSEVVDGFTVFPAHLLVDYVHVYSNDGAVPTVTPQSGYVAGGNC